MDAAGVQAITHKAEFILMRMVKKINTELVSQTMMDVELEKPVCGFPVNVHVLHLAFALADSRCRPRERLPCTASGAFSPQDPHLRKLLSTDSIRTNVVAILVQQSSADVIPEADDRQGSRA
jgi:hypothetical protein